MPEPFRLCTRDELVERYAPLVKYVIARTSISLSVTLDADDVLSAGTVGLLQAVDRYDPDQGVRFETFALQRIRGAIVDAIRSVSPLSRGASRRFLTRPRVWKVCTKGTPHRRER